MAESCFKDEICRLIALKSEGEYWNFKSVY